MKLMNTITKITAFALCASIAFTTSAADEQQEGQIYIECQPTDCKINFNGENLGISPQTVTNLPAGEHLIIARKTGHKEVRKSVMLAPNQKTGVILKVEPILGLLLIKTDPEGCTVRIEDTDLGKTPLLLTTIPLGKHKIRLLKDGCLPKTIEINIKDRTPKIIKHIIESNSATISVSSKPTGASILIDGIDKGTTPATIRGIPEGKHLLELKLEGHTPYTLKAKFTPGQKENMTAILKPISPELKIFSIPTGARIYVNNQFEGVAPVSVADLTPGTYRLRAELDAYSPAARTVELEPAQILKEEFRLVKNSGEIKLTTAPVGVTVLVDDKKIGETTSLDPKSNVSSIFTIDFLTPGTHQIKLTKKGCFPLAFAVEIEKKKTLKIHKTLRRKFTPNYEVKVGNDVIRGELVNIDGNGNVKLEVRRGVFKTFSKGEIKFQRPLKQ